jgi:hypothetical protein
MTLMQFIKPAGGFAAVALIGFGALSIVSSGVQADSNSEVQIGFAITPVRLNTKGLNPALVGKGSYIVNAKGDCNGCHNSPGHGGEWAPGFNPYFGQPKMVNAAGFLGGGATFGPFPGLGPGSSTDPMINPLFIYSRNLTPGCDTSPCTKPLPEGGSTFEQFRTIMRTGHDYDDAHPPCPTKGAVGCIASPPFDASLLQVMPWPVQANMSDDDIRAIYEYLRAIPCVSNAEVPDLPSILYQYCPE